MRAHLVRSHHRLTALATGCFSHGKTVVETLEQPRLEAPGVSRLGEPPQQRDRGDRSSDRRSVDVSMSGEQSCGTEVGAGRDRRFGLERVRRGQEHLFSLSLDNGATSVGPASGTWSQKGAPPHGCGSVHATGLFGRDPRPPEAPQRRPPTRLGSLSWALSN